MLNLIPLFFGLHQLIIDFLSKKLTYRRKQATVKNEILARALGLKKTSLPRIIDATAGLAQDSFMIACLGFEVTLIERSPAVYDSINEAMMRAKQDTALLPIMNRMNLIQADSIIYLSSLKPDERPDIIYLDPMFPERKKSALNKKAMRVLHDLVGEDLDANQLLHAALACASNRVVVKRPRLAEPLGGTKPSYSIIGNSSRFDIYQTGT